MILLLLLVSGEPERERVREQKDITHTLTYTHSHEHTFLICYPEEPPLFQEGSSTCCGSLIPARRKMLGGPEKVLLVSTYHFNKNCRQS